MHRPEIDEFLGVLLPQLLSVADDAFHLIASSIPSLTIDQQPTLLGPTRNLKAAHEPKFAEIVSACDSIDSEFRQLMSQVG
jgi:hypothetical protein